MKGTDLTVGARVAVNDARATSAPVGTVVRVIPGNWSNGGVPMVTVEWTSRFGTSVGRHTASSLVRVASHR